MDSTLTLAVPVVMVLGFYAQFYRRVVRHWTALVTPVVRRLGLEATRSVREIEAIGKLAAAGLAQALFAAILLVAFGPDARSLARIDPPLIAVGATLGAGELALAAFACSVLERARAALAPGSDDWLARSRGGWMALFSGTLSAAPAWVSGACIVLYVGGEEIIFRAVLVDAAREAGAVAAVVLSTLLFAAAQTFNLPSRGAAAFPVVGAVIVGLVHGALYWHVPQILPLICAHVVYFVAALVVVPAPAAQPAR